VHETGPYGFGHVVWQAIEETAEGDKAGRMDVRPIHWPIEESVAVLMEGIDRSDAPRTPGWSIWISQCDQWGAYYTEVGGSLAPPPEREGLWHELSPLVLQRARVA
ncbi:MAG: hypothetical protein NZM29_05020, partial [Nitrospira sp.]|nr:hypothetical protein [Nitrospira sp.]